VPEDDSASHVQNTSRPELCDDVIVTHGRNHAGGPLGRILHAFYAAARHYLTIIEWFS
jgi:hypothetical protein